MKPGRIYQIFVTTPSAEAEVYAPTATLRGAKIRMKWARQIEGLKTVEIRYLDCTVPADERKWVPHTIWNNPKYVWPEGRTK